MGFEPLHDVHGQLLPIRWKGTTARTVNGIIVRMHEIANAGEPMWNSTEAGEPTPRLGKVLQDAGIMSKERNRRIGHSEQTRFILLHGASAEAICVVKCCG
jgi:hypothetical protein